jgi:hypothetical protein
MDLLTEWQCCQTKSNFSLNGKMRMNFTQQKDFANDDRAFDVIL